MWRINWLSEFFFLSNQSLGIGGFGVGVGN